MAVDPEHPEHTEHTEHTEYTELRAHQRLSQRA